MQIPEGLFKLNWRDVLKSLVVAFITTVLAALYPIMQAGALPTLDQLKAAALAGALAMVGYLVKNFLTPAPKTETTPEG